MLVYQRVPPFMETPIWMIQKGTVGLRSQARQHPSQQRHSTWSPWEYPEPSGSTSLKSEYSPEKKRTQIWILLYFVPIHVQCIYIYMCVHMSVCILYASQYVFIFISLHTLNVRIKISHIHHLLRLRVLRVACPGQSTKDTWRTKLRPDMWRIQWPDMWDIVNTSNQ